MPSPSPEERSLAATVAINTRWFRTKNLNEAETRAHLARLQLASARSRRKLMEAAQVAAAAESELTELASGGDDVGS